MNEKFDAETLNIQQIKIHPYYQQVKIHPYRKPLNIHPYPCQGRKSNMKGIASIWPNFRIVKWKLLKKCLGKWMVIKYSRSTVVKSIGMMHREIPCTGFLEAAVESAYQV